MARLRTCIVLLALLAVCAAAPAAAACSDQDLRGLTFLDAPSFRTRLVDVQGEEHWYDGALDTETLEAAGCFGLLASWHLYYEDESVLDVELRSPDLPEESGVSLFGDPYQAGNGCYAVQFDVYDRGIQQYCQAYITGLSRSNLDAVQSGLISARQNGTAFELTQVDFIDAEKMDPNRGGTGLDSEMCWAAACANVIHYTGWAVRADQIHNFTGEGFTDGDRIYHEDRLFNTFVSFFQDAGGKKTAGLTWFFSGINPAQGSGSSAQVDNGSYGRLAGFLPSYAPDSAILGYDLMGGNGGWRCNQNIVPVLDRLREGWGCALGLGWYYESDGRYRRDGGHVVTLWGYIRKKTFANNGTDYLSSVNPNDYLAFLVTDSDSDKYGSTSRGYFGSSYDATTAPNKLQMKDLRYVGYTNSGGETECTWQLLGYSGSIGLVEDATLLRPYSSSIPQEDQDLPHGDRFSAGTPEISAFLRLSDENDIDGRDTAVFRAQDGGTARVNLFAGVKNVLYDWTADHPCQVRLTVTDSSGKKVCGWTKTCTRRFNAGGYTWWTENLDLPGGEYTASVSVALTDGSYEAFYTNNTVTQAFTVIDARQRVFQAELTGASANTLRIRVDCPEPFEYARLGYCYRLEDGTWSDWEWDRWVESASNLSCSIPARQADQALLRLDCHREYQNYVLLSNAIPIRFTAALDGGGGTVSPSSFRTFAGMPYGTGLSAGLPTPVREGYRFDGWYTAPAGGTRIYGSTYATACKNETLYPHWSCILTLDPNGGSLSQTSVTVPQGSVCGSLPAPTRLGGYSFAGWYGPDGSPVDETTVIDRSMTLTAKWHFRCHLFPGLTTEDYYTARFREGDPVGAAADLAAYGGALPVPARRDYRFDGWYTLPSGGERVTEKTIANRELHWNLFAHWTYKWAVSAQVGRGVMRYDVLVLDGTPAHLLLAAYDSGGRMIFSQMLPNITTGTGSLSVPSADHYKAFLVHSGSFVPMCPAWSSKD